MMLPGESLEGVDLPEITVSTEQLIADLMRLMLNPSLMDGVFFHPFGYDPGYASCRWLMEHDPKQSVNSPLPERMWVDEPGYDDAAGWKARLDRILELTQGGNGELQGQQAREDVSPKGDA